MDQNCMERDCVWQKKQKWRVDDQEAGLQEDRALQEEVTLGEILMNIYAIDSQIRCHGYAS